MGKVLNFKYYMHCFIGLLLFLLCSTSLFGQINKGRKFLTNANYEAALEAFENDVDKTTSKPISLYEIARIYYQKKYDNYDLDKAFLFTTRAIKEFEALSSSQKRQVQKKGVSLPELKKLQQNIVRTALQFYKNENSIEGLQHFVDNFTSANQQQLEQAYQQRNVLLIQQARSSNTFAAYKMVWERYKKNMERYSPKEIKQVECALLETYIAEKGWSMYPRFEELYPENVYVLSRNAAYDYLKIRRSSDPKAFQQFIEAYPKSPFNKFAKSQLLQLILKDNQLPDYDAFIRAYPDHPDLNELWKRFYELYTQDGQGSTITAFATAYPNYPFQEELKKDLVVAQVNLEKPLYLQIIATKDIVLAMNFVQKFPSSSYIPSLENTFYEALQKKPLLRGSRYFITRYPNSTYYDAVLEMYYKEYIKDGELGTLNQFMMEHPEYKNLSQQTKDLKVAEQGAQLDLSKMPTNATKPLYEAYIRAAAPQERAFVALQRLVEPSIRQKRWDKAQQIINSFESYFAADPTKIQQLKLLLTAPDYTSNPLPSIVNSDRSERVVTIDKSQLFFARKNILYSTIQQEKEWSTPILEPVINEGITGEYWTMNRSTKELVYSEAGNLYYRSLKEGKWSTPIAFSKAINRPDRELEVQLSTDGNALLYSSESDQVLDWKTALVAKNFHGTEQSNSDLFVVLKDKNGKWQLPINLGDQINSPFAERYPFLHPDGKTLYFSSEGHGGLGGLDLYYTRRLDDTWQHWSIPVNMGTGINSADHEGPCAVSLDFLKVYFTRQDEEGKMMYQYFMPAAKQ